MFENLKHNLNSNNFLDNIRTSKTSIVISVTVGLFLENILLTVVIPIIPEHLSDLETNITKSKLSSIIDSSTADKALENLSELNIKDNVEESTSDDHFMIGILLASKAIVQILTNPFVGCVTKQIGFKMLLVCGFTIILSTL